MCCLVYNSLLPSRICIPISHCVFVAIFAQLASEQKFNQTLVGMQVNDRREGLGDRQALIIRRLRQAI